MYKVLEYRIERSIRSGSSAFLADGTHLSSVFLEESGWFASAMAQVTADMLGITILVASRSGCSVHRPDPKELAAIQNDPLVMFGNNFAKTCPPAVRTFLTPRLKHEKDPTSEVFQQPLCIVQVVTAAGMDHFVSGRFDVRTANHVHALEGTVTSAEYCYSVVHRMLCEFLPKPHAVLQRFFFFRCTCSNYN